MYHTGLLEMKIGYPCINRTVACQGNKTFRLKSYSPSRLSLTIQNNLACLGDILEFNVTHNLLFFRITSDLIPFASHPICTYPWQTYFQDTFHSLGDFINSHQIRISMHPDQFTLLNSPDPQIFTRSVKELSYHAQVLDLMGLDATHKIQIHVGGKYDNKKKSIQRFIHRYKKLPSPIRQRLVIENDDRLYTPADCLIIHEQTHIPLLYDSFHHETNPDHYALSEVLGHIVKTWTPQDGIPMVDYSSQEPQMRAGKHAETINPYHFQNFLRKSQPHDCDIMLEIKDKDISAKQALSIAQGDPRIVIPLGGK